MDAVRYGIIGLGQVATKGHIPSLLSLPGAAIVAVADMNADAVSAAVSKVGKARGYRSAEELLADKDVEAVVVATPNWLHKEQAIAAFQAGKHVFCEKPLGIDLAECDAILAAWQGTGKVLQVGHELRYSALMQAAREKIASGLIGELQMAAVHEFRFPLLPGWRQTARTGGVMLEKNSHFFDLMNWLIGAEPVRVVGSGGNNVNHDSPLIDHCIVTVEYANHAKGTLFMCLFAEHGSPLTIDLVGAKGRLVLNCDDSLMTHYWRDSEESESWDFAPPDNSGWHIGFKEEHAAFIESVRTGAPVLVDGQAARRTMRVCLAAEEAVGGSGVVAL